MEKNIYVSDEEEEAKLWSERMEGEEEEERERYSWNRRECNGGESFIGGGTERGH